MPFQNWLEHFDKFLPKLSKISKICTLMGFLWPKYIMLDLKMYRGIMFDVLNINSKLEGKLTCAFKFQRVLQTGTLMGFFYPKWKMYELKWKMIQNWSRNWLVFLKLTRGIWQILIRALKNLKNLVFNELFVTEDWCKIWRKTDLCFQKRHEEFDKFDRLRNSDFILDSKMAKLNQNQNPN